MNASFVKNIFLTFNAWIQTEISSLEMTFNFCYDNMNLNIKYVHNILCILRLNLYRKTPLWDWPSSHAQKIISYVDTKLSFRELWWGKNRFKERSNILWTKRGHFSWEKKTWLTRISRSCKYPFLKRKMVFC